jgi:hypothetical protein
MEGEVSDRVQFRIVQGGQTVFEISGYGREDRWRETLREAVKRAAEGSLTIEEYVVGAWGAWRIRAKWLVGLDEPAE